MSVTIQPTTWATQSNFKKYNFEGQLESFMANCYKNKEYKRMVTELTTHIESCVNALMYFGNADAAKTMLKGIHELTSYTCLPVHKHPYYYKLSNAVESTLADHWVSRETCIEYMYKCVDVIILQYGLN
ncbi:hypothetical protein [Bacillus altitudinis]|uniref:hypothetical protein n=1 Tax=Bacillus altitudinis TaxID=293387 RepID=UPI0011A1D42E|nr:hypothetical protein [Bacillus altitudinis]